MRSRWVRHALTSLVQTAEGLPIAQEVHPGNTAEAKTLLPMIRGLLARYPLKRVVLIADRGLLSTANIEELDKLKAQLKKDGRDVAVEYILAVPAARYGDVAEDLQKLHKGEDATQEWCAETTWVDSRLVVAHDPVAANRRTAARDNKMAELVKLGQQCSVKLDEQDESHCHLSPPDLCGFRPPLTCVTTERDARQRPAPDLVNRAFVATDINQLWVADMTYIPTWTGYCSWERGLNENHNGLLRQFFPKSTNLLKVSQDEVNDAVYSLNHRPRKCLGYRTPHEVFYGFKITPLKLTSDALCC